MLPLDVSEAFHSSYMMPVARQSFKTFSPRLHLDGTTAFISNVDATDHRDAETLEEIVDETTLRVRPIRNCVRQAIQDGVDTFIEFVRLHHSPSNQTNRTPR